MESKQKIPNYTPSTTTVRPHYVKQHIRGTNIIGPSYRNGGGHPNIDSRIGYKRKNSRG
ncbi:hypothetical protein [Paenibacillus sp.]|uniref:hypothetical protein n=1 Tax=Paenibacillus sp. TaxID=58172 RepID=UPI002D6B2787|nr:hypothetical protein [Paenibacillus sp.]HZG85592.1 hypothetical protein [Paenibacillus sp.]